VKPAKRFAVFELAFPAKEFGKAPVESRVK
jgi:hypothetical protein